MRNKKGIVLMMVLMILVFSAGVTASEAIKNVTASINSNLKLTFDGKQVTPVDVNGNPVPILTYNGSSYLPVRSVSSLAGLEVDWDQATQTIKLIKDPVNLNNPTIIDLHRANLVKLNKYGDKDVDRTGDRNASVITDKDLLTDKDGKFLGAGLFFDSSTSTAHTDLIEFASNGKARFNTVTMELNRNYTTMKGYVKIKSVGSVSSVEKFLKSEFRVYDVNNNFILKAIKFADLKIAKDEESDFIYFEVDVTNVDRIALIPSNNLNFEEVEFIIAGIQFEK